MSDAPSSLRAQTAIDDAAAEWFARRDAGWSAGESRAFERWLAADPRHAAAWREYAAAFRPLDEARATGTAGDLMRELAQRQRRRRWRIVAGSSVGLAAAAAVAAVLFHLRTGPVQDVKPSASTVIVSRPERRELIDGSVVELNRGAAIEVAFTEAQRRVELVRGEAHFKVTSDSARPFVVSAGGVEVRAVGTAFSVEAGTAAINVVVTHGRVAVERVSGEVLSTAAPAVREVLADAGSRVSVPAGGVPEVTSMPSGELERRLTWRGPRLELSGTPLAEVVAVLNRGNRVQLVIADPALAEMRLSGVFPAGNTEGFAHLLKAHYGVDVERGDGVITLRPAQ